MSWEYIRPGHPLLRTCKRFYKAGGKKISLDGKGSEYALGLLHGLLLVHDVVEVHDLGELSERHVVMSRYPSGWPETVTVEHPA